MHFYQKYRGSTYINTVNNLVFHFIVHGNFSDRLVKTHVFVSARSGHGVEECAYIREEGRELSVTVNCETKPVGRFVSLVKDEAASNNYIMHVCEVEIVGRPGGVLYVLSE